MGVYVIGHRTSGPVKVGYSTNATSLASRLATLQIGNPVPLEVLQWWPTGSLADERALHLELRPARHVGEWFEPTAHVCRVLQIPERDSIAPTLRTTLQRIATEAIDAADELRKILVDLVGEDWLLQHALRDREQRGLTPDSTAAAQRIYPPGVARSLRDELDFSTGLTPERRHSPTDDERVYAPCAPKTQ